MSQANRKSLFALKATEETVIDLKLPINSYCVDLAVSNDCLLAIFNIPDRGNVPYIIYPDKKEAHEIKFNHQG